MDRKEIEQEARDYVKSKCNNYMCKNNIGRYVKTLCATCSKKYRKYIDEKIRYLSMMPKK